MKIYLADKEVIKEGWGVSVWVRAGPGKRIGGDRWPSKIATVLSMIMDCRVRPSSMTRHST